MKRRRFRRWGLVILAGSFTSIAINEGHAQRSASVEGAAFLLRPIGARAVGLGQAVVTRRDGSEAVWWNPAGLAASSHRELAIHHSQDFFATGDAVSIVLPSALLGVIGVSADVEDYGEQENTSSIPGVPATGTVLPRSFILSATYATPIGARVRSGVAFKVVQLRFDCSGLCDLPTTVAQSYALDAGLQYDLGSSGTVSLGASVRNVGLPLQVEDSPQADPLPSRVQAGIDVRLPLPARYAKDAAVNVTVDVIDGLRIRNPLPRLGCELAWQKRAFVRGGYVFQSAGSEAGGPSLGLGIKTRNVSIDLARVLSGFSVDLGQAPTYLSLRLEF